MFMMFDPVLTMISLIGLPLVFLPQLWVKNTFNRVSKIETRRGLSGRYVAEDMLKRQQITDVQVEPPPTF